tara:strand:+ start:7377 stop:8306 length:930 start_codon:yes stop_codon:yes gene_type:complete
MVSLRHFTSEQFAEGTTIDGDRLEKALQDLEDWSNNIEDGQFRNRWLQSQYVLKYLPPTASANGTLVGLTALVGNYRHAPFLPVYNAAGNQNPFRVKGNRLWWQDGYTKPTDLYQAWVDAGAVPPATPDVIYNDQCVWTSAIALGQDPAIINSIDLVMLTYDDEYTTDWKYDSASAAYDAATRNYSNDIHLLVTADNPFLPNLQLKNTVVFHKFQSVAEASFFSVQAIGLALVSDMEPKLTSVTGMNPTHEYSISMNLDDLNIPIPPFTRLRFSLILPLESGAEPWGIKPWQNSIPTMTLTLLERSVNG